MSFMDLLASRKAKLGGKYLLPADDLQPLVEAETAADMGEEEVDMVELREEEMVEKVNEEEVREVVDDSKEKDKGKKSLKRSLTSIVKKNPKNPMGENCGTSKWDNPNNCRIHASWPMRGSRR